MISSNKKLAQTLLAMCAFMRMRQTQRSDWFVDIVTRVIARTRTPAQIDQFVCSQKVLF